MTASGESTGTILIVEDSKTQAEYLRHILTQGGRTVEMAANGRIATEMIAARPPALVLTDIVMPEMDGYELCRWIKQNPRTSATPVILVTQLFDPADVIRGLEAGADNFIIKPFDPDSVFTRIAEALLAADDRSADRNELMTVCFFGKQYTITAGRLRILTILLSTYDLAVRKNVELLEAHERLQSLNEQLQQTVDELQVANEDLQIENTSRERAERDFAQANKKLQLLTSITRHDINNQLVALNGFLELLHEEAKNSALDRYFTQISTASRRIEAMIQFTKEYDSIGISSPVWHRVADLVNDSAKYASLGSVILENRIPPSVEIYADPLIGKVIFNLIDNAIRYAPPLTCIRFRCERDGTAQVLICEDDGIGIPVENKERIFSYGYGTNTGMGLFLTREILSITGITIRENGTRGKGARFEIVLPENGFRIRPPGS